MIRIWKIQRSGLGNRKNVFRLNREIEKCVFEDDFGAVEQNGWYYSIRHEILHKKHISWFFRKFWSGMNCRELQLDFEIPGGFCSDYWILHEILSNICASEIPSSKWNGSDSKDRFYFIFYKKKNKTCERIDLAL